MILTTVARSVNAVSFKDAHASDLWCVLGKYSAWSDDTNPPVPVISQTAPLQPFCAIKATPYLLLENEPGGAYAFIVASATLHFDTDSSDADFITNAGNLVMPLASRTGADIVALQNTFRQVCFVTGLIPAAGHSSDTFLADANITSYGNLILVQNYRPIPVYNTNNYAFRGLLQY